MWHNISFTSTVADQSGLVWHSSYSRVDNPTHRLASLADEDQVIFLKQQIYSAAFSG